MWRLNNMLPNNEGVSEEIKKETNICIGKYTGGGGFQQIGSRNYYGS